MGRPRKDAWREKYKSAEKYRQKAIKNYIVAVNKLTEPDIMEKLDSEKNKSGYIKGLIRKDIKK